jgi:hypothetical protein
MASILPPGTAETAGSDDRRLAWWHLQNHEQNLSVIGLHGPSSRSRQPGFNSVGNQHPRTSLSSRVSRVRSALDEAKTLAWEQIANSFSALNIAMVWPVLIGLVSDIALYVGGGAVSGAAVGGIVGFFLGGVGAAPGAVAGASLGSSAGLTLLNWMGLASLAKDLAHAIPQALNHYITGFKTAWGPEPAARSGYAGFSVCTPIGPSDHLLPNQAAKEIAQGHVILISAMLLAIMVYVTRGKGDKAALINDIRNSKRLGPQMAEWVEANEAKFGAQMAMMENRAASKSAGSGGASSGSPSKPSAEPKPAKQTPEAVKDKPSTNKQKSLTGEAAGRDYMQRNGFEKNQRRQELERTGC